MADLQQGRLRVNVGGGPNPGDTAHNHREPTLAALVLGADRATRRPLRARVRAAIAHSKTPLDQAGLTIHMDQP